MLDRTEPEQHHDAAGNGKPPDKRPVQMTAKAQQGQQHRRQPYPDRQELPGHHGRRARAAEWQGQRDEAEPADDDRDVVLELGHGRAPMRLITSRSAMPTATTSSPASTA